MSTHNLAGPSVAVVVPRQFADELTETGIGAVVARARHQPGAVEVVLTVLSASSSVVTLVVARADLGDLVERLARFLRRTTTTAELEVPEQVPADLQAGLDELLVVLRRLGDLLHESTGGTHPGR